MCADQTRSVRMPKRRKGIGALVAKEPEAYDPWDALPGAEELFPEEEVYDPWDEVGIAVPAIRRVNLTPIGGGVSESFTGRRPARIGGGWM